MNAVLPPEIARALGLTQTGASILLEVTEVRPDGSVSVRTDSEDDEEESAQPIVPQELLAALGRG